MNILNCKRGQILSQSDSNYKNQTKRKFTEDHLNSACHYFNLICSNPLCK